MRMLMTGKNNSKSCVGEKGLEGALKPVDEHEDNVTALQSKGKEVPKYMWLWEEWYGDREKENENEEESVREVRQTRKDREETEVRSPLTMQPSTPSVADKRASTRTTQHPRRHVLYNISHDPDLAGYDVDPIDLPVVAPVKAQHLGKGIDWKRERDGSRITSVATAAPRTFYKGKRGGDWDTATVLDMSFPLEEERYQLDRI
eukprot:g59195.t1